MRTVKIAKHGAALALIMTTAGCLGGGTGGPVPWSSLTGAGAGAGAGGGGGGDPFAAYDAAYDAATAAELANAPTSDMPISGGADFSGEFKLTDIRDGAGDIVADAIIGDVALEVGFGRDATGTISGTVDNLRASVDGQTVASDLVLTTGHAAGLGFDSVMATVENTVDVPGQGPLTVRTGSYSAFFGAGVSAGDLPGVEEDGDLLLTLGGTFTGPGAQGAYGPALGQLVTGTSLAAYSGAGSHYTTRD